MANLSKYVLHLLIYWDCYLILYHSFKLTLSILFLIIILILIIKQYLINPLFTYLFTNFIKTQRDQTCRCMQRKILCKLQDTGWVSSEHPCFFRIWKYFSKLKLSFRPCFESCSNFDKFEDRVSVHQRTFQIESKCQ